MNIKRSLIDKNKKIQCFNNYGYNEDRNFNPIKKIYNELINL